MTASEAGPCGPGGPGGPADLPLEADHALERQRLINEHQLIVERITPSGVAQINVRRNQLIEAMIDSRGKIPIVERTVDSFTFRMNLDFATRNNLREDWKLQGRISLINSVDLFLAHGGMAPSLELDRNIRRNLKSRLVELAERWWQERDATVHMDDVIERDDTFSGAILRARSLNPDPSSQWCIEEIGEVQLLMFKQCMKHFPKHALRHLLPTMPMDKDRVLVPANKARLLSLARTHINTSWLAGLTEKAAEPMLLCYSDLGLTFTEAAEVLGITVQAVSKSIKKSVEMIANRPHIEFTQPAGSRDRAAIRKRTTSTWMQEDRKISPHISKTVCLRRYKGESDLAFLERVKQTAREYATFNFVAADPDALAAIQAVVLAEQRSREAARISACSI